MVRNLVESSFFDVNGRLFYEMLSKLAITITTGRSSSYLGRKEQGHLIAMWLRNKEEVHPTWAGKGTMSGLIKST